MAGDITQIISDSVIQANEQAAQNRQLAQAQKDIKRELKQALKRINGEYSVSTKNNPADWVRTIGEDMKQYTIFAGLVHGLNFMVLGGAAMAISNPLGGFFMMMTGATCSSTIAASPNNRECINIYLNSGRLLGAPFVYAARAITGKSLDPRLWRRNAKQICNEIWDNLPDETKFDMAREYLKEGMNDKIAIILSNRITDYMKKHVVLRNKDSKEALPAIFRTVLTDPQANPGTIIEQGISQSRTLPDFSGNSVKRGQKNPRLDVQVPDTQKARQKLEVELKVFDDEKIGLSPVVLFGNVASHEAQETRQKIHHWQIRQHAALPPSLAVMEKILDDARKLRDIVLADPAKNKRGLIPLFSGGKNQDDRLYNTAVSIMKNAAALRGTIESDIRNFENLLDDNEKAQDALEAHADILESYSEAFNAVASDLKKKTALRVEGKRLVRFTPDTINQTREGLAVNALTARQEAAAYEHIHQPEQEFLLRTLPVLSARSTDITKVLEGANRHARLKEMAAIAGKTSEDRQLGISGSDVRAYHDMSNEARKQVDLQIVAELDAVLEPWHKTVEDVKEVFALDDYRDKRLQITYQTMDERGRSAPGSIEIVPVITE